jgi:outer membrane protein assembly factor BamD
MARRLLLVAFFGVLLSLCFAAACASSGKATPPNSREPDKFLFEKGNEALNDKKWLRAREFLRQIVDNYPQSPFRPDAKLGVADSYLGEGSAASLVLAINEYQEFLTFYPTNRRADYAQYKLGMTHFKQMRGPERDQTETRDAVKELQAFVERYPNSELITDGKVHLREAKNRLGDSEFHVGYFYYRTRWYPGAIDRFKALIKSDPEYTGRDAVYFYLAEALVKTDKKSEALPYYERLINEFEQSEFLEDAQKRVTELKAVVPPTTTTSRQ